MTRTGALINRLSASSRNSRLRNVSQRFLSEKDRRVIKNFGIEQLLIERLFDWHGHDFRAAEGSHVTELFFADQLDGFDTEPGCKNPVVGCRRAAALDVAENGHPGFDSGLVFDLFSKPVPNSAKLGVTELIDVTAFRENLMGFVGRSAFGNHNDGKLAAPVDA